MKALFALCLVVLASQLAAYAQPSGVSSTENLTRDDIIDRKFELLLQTQTELSNRINNLSASLGERIDQNKDELFKLQALSQGVQEVVIANEKLTRLREDVDEELDNLDSIEEKYSTLTAQAATAENTAEGAQTTAQTIGIVVAAVSLTVTVIIAVVSLVFSSRFTTLYADTQLAKGLLTRIEGRLDAFSSSRDPGRKEDRTSN